MVFQFEVMDIDSGGTDGGVEAVSPLTCRDWHLRELKHTVEKWQQYNRDGGYWNTCAVSRPCIYILIHVLFPSTQCLYRESRSLSLGIALRKRHVRVALALCETPRDNADDAERDAVRLSGRGDWHEELSPVVGHRGVQGCCVDQLLGEVRVSDCMHSML